MATGQGASKSQGKRGGTLGEITPWQGAASRKATGIMRTIAELKSKMNDPATDKAAIQVRLRNLNSDLLKVAGAAHIEEAIRNRQVGERPAMAATMHIARRPVVERVAWPTQRRRSRAKADARKELTITTRAEIPSVFMNEVATRIGSTLMNEMQAKIGDEGIVKLLGDIYFARAKPTPDEAKRLSEMPEFRRWTEIRNFSTKVLAENSYAIWPNLWQAMNIVDPSKRDYKGAREIIFRAIHARERMLGYFKSENEMHKLVDAISKRVPGSPAWLALQKCERSISAIGGSLIGFGSVKVDAEKVIGSKAMDELVKAAREIKAEHESLIEQRREIDYSLHAAKMIQDPASRKTGWHPNRITDDGSVIFENPDTGIKARKKLDLVPGLGLNFTPSPDGKEFFVVQGVSWHHATHEELVAIARYRMAAQKP